MHPHTLIFLVGLLAAAVYFDHRAHRIPNALTFGGIVAGCAFAALGVSWSGTALPGSVAGAALGIALFLPLYALGKMGGGDVKLLGAVGAFLGPVGVFWAAMYTLIAGGVLALAWLFAGVGFRQMAYSTLGSWAALKAGGGVAQGGAPQGRTESLMKSKIPYALAIAVGSVAAAAFQGR